MQTDRGRETHRHTGTDIHTHGDTHSWTDTEGDTYAETHCGPETPPVFSDSKNTFFDHWIKKLEFAVEVHWQTLCEGPNGQYFRLAGHCGNYSVFPLNTKSSHRQSINT